MISDIANDAPLLLAIAPAATSFPTEERRLLLIFHRSYAPQMDERRLTEIHTSTECHATLGESRHTKPGADAAPADILRAASQKRIMPKNEEMLRYTSMRRAGIALPFSVLAAPRTLRYFFTLSILRFRCQFIDATRFADYHAIFVGMRSRRDDVRSTHGHD